MNMLNRLILIFTFFTFLPAQIFGKDETIKLKIGYIDFYPLFYTNSKNQAEGQYIALSQMIAKDLNWEITPVLLPAQRLMRDLGSGKIDLWFGLKSIVEGQNLVEASKETISKITLNAYSLSPDHQFSSQNIKKALKSFKIILIRGYSYGGLFHYFTDPKNNYNYILLDSHEQAISFLLKKRGDVLLDYHGPFNEIKKSNFSDTQFYAHEIDSFYAHIVISKTTPNYQLLLKKLESSMLKFRDKIPN